MDDHFAKRRNTLEDEIGQLNSYVDGSRRVTRTTKRSPLVGVKVKPKYRGPKGETWAGRGVHPTWLAVLLKAGHKIEEYAIGGAKLDAARKSVARKVAGKPARKKASRKKG